MSKSSFNFTQALKTVMETEEIKISATVDEVLQDAIQELRDIGISLSKEMLNEIYFIQANCNFSEEDDYEEDDDEDYYYDEEDDEEDYNGDTIYIALKNPQKCKKPFIIFYEREFESIMEASIILNEIRKKLMNEELKTKEFMCEGALENGKSFSVKIEN